MSPGCSGKYSNAQRPFLFLTSFLLLRTIKRPQNVILAPVDDLGEMRELCSEACLTSVKTKRSLALKGPTPQPVGPRSECRMCVRYSHVSKKETHSGAGTKVAVFI